MPRSPFTTGTIEGNNDFSMFPLDVDADVDVDVGGNGNGVCDNDGDGDDKDEEDLIVDDEEVDDAIEIIVAKSRKSFHRFKISL